MTGILNSGGRNTAFMMDTTATLAKEWSGPAIQALRRALKESTTAFGERVGRSRRTVEDWEQGRRRPDVLARREFERLAEAVADAGCGAGRMSGDDPSACNHGPKAKTTRRARLQEKSDACCRRWREALLAEGMAVQLRHEQSLEECAAMKQKIADALNTDDECDLETALAWLAVKVATAYAPGEARTKAPEEVLCLANEGRSAACALP